MDIWENNGKIGGSARVDRGQMRLPPPTFENTDVIVNEDLHTHIYEQVSVGGYPLPKFMSTDFNFFYKKNENTSPRINLQVHLGGFWTSFWSPLNKLSAFSIEL